MKQNGSAPIFVLIVLAIIVIVLFKDTTIKDKLTFYQQTTKEESNILNRVYYLKLGDPTSSPSKELDFIDAGSGEKGKIVLNTDFFTLKSGIVHRDFPDYYSQISPDKKYIIFKNNPTYSDENLYLFDISKNEVRQLTTEASPPKGNECPVKIDFLVSPDSQKVYYKVSNHSLIAGASYKPINEEGKVCKPQEIQEYITDLNGNKQKINPIFEAQVIGWSADNQSLYYLYHSYQLDQALREFNIQTGDTKVLLKDSVNTLLWSKDGSKGVFVGLARFDGGYSAPGAKNLGTINLIDSNFKILGTQQPREGVPDGEAMLNTGYKWYFWKVNSISPDGKYVALTKIPQEHFAQGDSGWNDRILSQYSEVYLWDTGTGLKDKLPFTVDSSASIKWIADSSRLIYHTTGTKVDPGNRSKDSDALYSYDIKTKKVNLLIDFYNDLKGGYQYLLY